MNYSTYSNGDDGYRKVGEVSDGMYYGKTVVLDLMCHSMGNDNFKYYALTKFGQKEIVVYRPKRNTQKPRSNRLITGDRVNVGGHDTEFSVFIS